MAKAKPPRKTLGRVDDPHILSLAALMKSQSKATIARWCLDYAQRVVLPIYQETYPQDPRGMSALEGARRWLAGDCKLPEVRTLILDAHAAAREAEDNPAAQAAIRAVGHAASVVHVPSHAMGLALYGTAAIAYHRVGLAQPQEVYDCIAVEECAKMETALRAIAVEGEPNPAKFRWRGLDTAQ